MRKKVKGSMTIEAALIFPLIFGICMIFIQIACYFMTIVYVKTICSQSLLICNAEYNQGSIYNVPVYGKMERYMRESLENYSMIREVNDITAEKHNFLVCETITVNAEGSFEILYPMEFRVAAAGYMETPVKFCNTIDFVRDVVRVVQSNLK